MFGRHDSDDELDSVTENHTLLTQKVPNAPKTPSRSIDKFNLSRLFTQRPQEKPMPSDFEQHAKQARVNQKAISVYGYSGWVGE